jgi:NhaP-type Na+/H+ or K+/H+ antiporter
MDPDRCAGGSLLQRCRRQRIRRVLSSGRISFSSLVRPGLATVVFAVLVLGEKPPGNDTILLAAGWTVLLSVVAHGVTGNPLVKRMAGRSPAEATR